RHRFKVSAIT
ncbi:type IV/VI secretion system, DotU family domain protein, partial [Vibrio parahaemolyticus EKP-021]